MKISACCYEPIREGKCSLCKEKAVELNILDYCAEQELCINCPYSISYKYGKSHSDQYSDLTEIECWIAEDKDFESKCLGYKNLIGEI